MPKKIYSIVLEGSVRETWIIADAKPGVVLGIKGVQGKTLTLANSEWFLGTETFIPLDKIKVVVTWQSEDAWRHGHRNWKLPQQVKQGRLRRR
jgi:hypothetical protein